MVVGGLGGKWEVGSAKSSWGPKIYFCTDRCGIWCVCVGGCGACACACACMYLTAHILFLNDLLESLCGGFYFGPFFFFVVGRIDGRARGYSWSTLW